jgi:chemotaxis protein methyltransferase CheR
VITVTREFSDQAYQSLVELVYEYSRIVLGSDKQLMLANRLRKRARTLGFDHLDDYALRLVQTRDVDELEELVDLVSTNHTQFFRESQHFSFLAQTIVPQLLPELLATGAPLRIWSAASSSGEEAYSVALVLAEQLQAHPTLQWEVLASDISNRMLAHAREAVYPMARVKPVRAELLRRFFQRGFDESEGKCRVNSELRGRLKFERINLFQESYPVAARQHVIFCRNVMIYFDLASRAQAVERLTRHLMPGGYLIIGLSESLHGVRHELQHLGNGIYRLP